MPVMRAPVKTPSSNKAAVPKSSANNNNKAKPSADSNRIGNDKQGNAASSQRKEDRRGSNVVKRAEDRRNSNRRSSNFDRKSMQSNNNISNRSSLASYGSELKVKVAFHIKSKTAGSDVFFKQDGERFKLEQTLKLTTATEYTMKMEVKPAMELLFIKLAGVDYRFELLSDLEDEEKSVYQFFWSTSGIDPTLRRHRADVPCVLKFKSYKELDFKLQVKFYPINDSKHTTWGQKLSSVKLDCTAGRGTYVSYVDNIHFI